MEGNFRGLSIFVRGSCGRRFVDCLAGWLGGVGGWGA